MFSLWIFSGLAVFVVTAIPVFGRGAPAVSLVKLLKPCHIRAVMTKWVGLVGRGAKRLAAGLRLALVVGGVAPGLGGCALTQQFLGGSRQDDREGVWRGYFAGADLQSQCGGGSTDTLRLVWRPVSGGFRILEVVGDSAGGALLLHRAFDAGALVEDEPPSTLPAPPQRLALTPEGVSGLLYWFDRLGMFTPTPGGAGQPGGALEWLISGCLAGNWIFNVHLPPGVGEVGGVPLIINPGTVKMRKPQA